MASWHDLSLEIVSNILEHVVRTEAIFYIPVFTGPNTTCTLDTDLLSVGKSFLTRKQLQYIVSEKSSTKYHFIVRDHLDILSIERDFPGKAHTVSIWPQHSLFIKQNLEANPEDYLASPSTDSLLNSHDFFLNRQRECPRIVFAYQSHAKITLKLDCDWDTCNGLNYGDLNKAHLYIDPVPKSHFRCFDSGESSDMPHMAPAYLMCNIAARNNQVREVMRALRVTYNRDDTLPPDFCIYFELELIASTGVVTSQIAKFESRFWSVYFMIGDEKHEIQQAPPKSWGLTPPKCPSDIGCHHVERDYLSEDDQKLFDEKRADKYPHVNVWECPVVKWRKDLQN